MPESDTLFETYPKALLCAVLGLAFAAICALPTLAFADPTDPIYIDDIGSGSGDYHWYFDNADNSLSGHNEGLAKSEETTNYASYNASTKTLYLNGNIMFSTDGIIIYEESVTVIIVGDTKLFGPANITTPDLEFSLLTVSSSCTSFEVKSTNNSSLIMETDTTNSGWCPKAVFAEGSGSVTFSDLSSLTMTVKNYNNKEATVIASTKSVTFKNIENIDISCPTPSTQSSVGMCVVEVRNDETGDATLTFDSCKNVSVYGNTGMYCNMCVSADNLTLKSSNLGVKLDQTTYEADMAIHIEGMLLVDESSSLYATSSAFAMVFGTLATGDGLVVKGSTEASAEKPQEAVKVKEASKSMYMFAIGESPAKTIYIYNPNKPVDPEPTPEPIPATGDTAPFAGIAVLAIAASAAALIARRRMA